MESPGRDCHLAEWELCEQSVPRRHGAGLVISWAGARRRPGLALRGPKNQGPWGEPWRTGFVLLCGNMAQGRAMNTENELPKEGMSSLSWGICKVGRKREEGLARQESCKTLSDLENLEVCN